MEVSLFESKEEYQQSLKRRTYSLICLSNALNGLVPDAKASQAAIRSSKKHSGPSSVNTLFEPESESRTASPW